MGLITEESFHIARISIAIGCLLWVAYLSIELRKILQTESDFKRKRLISASILITSINLLIAAGGLFFMANGNTIGDRSFLYLTPIVFLSSMPVVLFIIFNRK